MVEETGNVHDAPSVSQEHYAAIGRVAVEWSSFEANIDLYSLRLAGFNQEEGICFTAQIAGSGRKLDAYIAIAQVRGLKAATVKKLHVFAADTQGLAEQRNRVVHDSWAGIGGPHCLEATARKKLKFEYVEVPTKEVLKLSHKISAHNERFYQLNEQIRAELDA
jgi:hypothetical protein